MFHRVRVESTYFYEVIIEAGVNDTISEIQKQALEAMEEGGGTEVDSNGYSITSITSTHRG